MPHNYRVETEHNVLKLSKIPGLTDEEIHTVFNAVLSVRSLDLPNKLNAFNVYYINESDLLGKYVIGTSLAPVVIIDPIAIKQYIEREGLSFEHEVLMTIMHELAHAYQDSIGVLDETDHTEAAAELFAHNYLKYGDLDFSILTPPDEFVKEPILVSSDHTSLTAISHPPVQSLHI